MRYNVGDIVVPHEFSTGTSGLYFDENTMSQFIGHPCRIDGVPYADENIYDIQGWVWPESALTPYEPEQKEDSGSWPGKEAEQMKKELLNEELACLIAPDGTPQTMFLAPDVPTCVALIEMLAKAGLSHGFTKLIKDGFKISPVSVTITQTGDENDAFQLKTKP